MNSDTATKVRLLTKNCRRKRTGLYLKTIIGWHRILTGADARTLGFVPGESVLGCWVTNGDEGYYLFGDFCRVDERYIGLLNNVVYNTLKGLNFYESNTCK